MRDGDTASHTATLKQTGARGLFNKVYGGKGHPIDLVPFDLLHQLLVVQSHLTVNHTRNSEQMSDKNMLQYRHLCLVKPTKQCR